MQQAGFFGGENIMKPIFSTVYAEHHPLVSVIIPSKNRLVFLQQAIESVLAQTYRNFEIIVVDDGSDEPLKPLLTERYHGKVICLRHDHSWGAPAARNTGNFQAKGNFVAFLDDDDIWLPKKLEKQMNEFLHLGEDIGVIYCGYGFLMNGAVIDRKNEYHDIETLDSLVLERCPIGSMTPIIRKRYFDAVGGFDVNLPACQDWDLWIRLTKICRFYSVQESLALYRVHGDQISTDVLKKINAREMIVEKYYGQMVAFPKILSSHYQRLGSLCSLAGRKKEARSYFLRSVQSNKINFGSWVHLLLQLGGRKIERLLIENYGTLKIGKTRVIN